MMDAWWPLWVRSQFQPRARRQGLSTLLAAVELDNAPNNHGDHLGSAYQDRLVRLRRARTCGRVLGRKVRGAVLARATAAAASCGAAGRCCGARCATRSPPRAATSTADDEVCADAGKASDQWCFDAVRQRPVGGATQPLIHWINRPTYQQVVEVQGPAGR